LRLLISKHLLDVLAFCIVVPGTKLNG
jgi:hypothetical protein